MNKRDLLLSSFFLIVIIVGLGVFLLNHEPREEGYSFMHPIALRLKAQQGDFPVIEIPDDFVDDFAEMFMDLLWDIDGDSGFEGVFPLAFSYIPFLGSKGDIFVEVIFLFSISFGVILLAMRIRRSR